MAIDVETMIRAAIGGDAAAVREVVAGSGTAQGDARAMSLGAVLAGDPSRLPGALAAAVTNRDRQIVAIASAFLAGDRGRVQLLARDHLADHPDSLVVAWIAAGAAGSSPSTP